jgi:hypothetical protein
MKNKYKEDNFERKERKSKLEQDEMDAMEESAQVAKCTWVGLQALQRTGVVNFEHLRHYS